MTQREQQGYRPAIVVAVPDLLDIPRFPLIVVIPLTTDRGQKWATASSNLYPRFSAGVAGLRSPSVALLDQVRALDVS
jgi:mRNA interferase MazF